MLKIRSPPKIPEGRITGIDRHLRGNPYKLKKQENQILNINQFKRQNTNNNNE